MNKYQPAVTNHLTQIAVDKKLIRDRWPQNLPQLRGHESLKTINGHLVVPEDEEHLYRWARVLNNPRPFDMYHKRALLLIDSSSPDRLKQVAIHVQGFVSPFNLSLGTLGNWDGRYAPCH